MLGASHDNGYANILSSYVLPHCCQCSSSSLSSLQTESRLSKLLLLKGYNDLANQLRQYSSRVVSIPDLFRSSKLPHPVPTQSFSAVVQSSPSAVERSAPVKAAESKESPESVASGGTLETDDSVEVIEWEAVPKPVKEKKEKFDKPPGKKGKNGTKPTDKGDNEWHEAGGNKKLGKKYKGKGGLAVTSVRNLKPRPCHTSVLRSWIHLFVAKDRYYLSPWGCKAGDDCDYGHDFSEQLQPRCFWTCLTTRIVR